MPGLQLKVGADISQAVTALKQYGAAVTQAGATTQAAASAMTGSVDKMQQETVNVFKSFTGVVVPAGTSWNGFVSLLKGPTKAAIKEATGQLLSCGEATREVAKEWALYKEQMQGATQAAQQVVNIPPPAPPSGNVSLDFTDKINAAIARIHANIDEASNAALGIGPKIAEGAKPGMTSLAALEAEMDRLKTAMSNTSNMSDFQKLSVQFGAVKLKADELRNSFISLSQVKVVNASMVIPSNLVQQVTAFGGGVRALPPLMDRVNSSLAITNQRTQQLGRNSGTASLALINTGRVLQDLPFGIMGVANNINPLLEGFQRLSAEAKSTGVSMGSLLKSAFLGGGGLGIAVSAVTAALTFAAVGFSMFSRGATKAKADSDDLGVSLDKLKEGHIEFEKSLRGAEASARSQGVALAEYVRIARDSSLAEGTRNQAMEKANEILGTHAEKLTKVNLYTQQTTDSVNILTQAFIAEAVAAEYSKRIGDLTVKQREATKEYTKALNEWSVAKQAADKLGTNLTSSNTVGSTGAQVASNANTLILEEERKAFNKRMEAANAYKLVTADLIDATGELNGATLKATEAFGKLKTNVNGAGDSFNFFDKTFSKNKEELKKHVDEMYNIAYEFAKGNRSKFKGLDPILKAPDKAAAVEYATRWWHTYQQGLSGVPKTVESKDNTTLDFFGQLFPARPTEIRKHVDEMYSLATEFARNNMASFEGLTPILLAPSKEGALDLAKEWWNKYQKGLAEVKTVSPLDIKLIPTVLPPSVPETLKEIKAPIDSIMESMKGLKISYTVSTDIKIKAQKIADLQKSFNESLQGAAQGAAESFGEALGNAFTGDFDGGKVFEIIGSFIQQIGRAIIIASNAMAGIKLALKSLFANPFAGLAVGVAAIALGQYIKSIGKMKAFADGGLVYGPTYGLIGEGIGTNKNNPEVVAPLDKLRKMIGGRSVEPQVILVQNTLRGKDLVLQAARTKKSQGRTI